MGNTKMGNTKMGHTKSFSVAQVDDDFEFDESYFRQFYKPLSNLPTPPPSTRASSANQSPRVSLDDTEGPNSQYLGQSLRGTYHFSFLFSEN